MRRSCNTFKFVLVVLEVSIYFQWKREWFFSRRVKFDSGFDVMAVFEVSWHGPQIIYRFTGIRMWALRWWKKPFWFFKKIFLTFSSNWVIPYRGGCSQFLISSRKFDSSVWVKMNFSFLWEMLLPLHWVFSSRFQMRPSIPTPQCLQPVRHPSKFSPAYKAYPRNIPGKTFFPNWWILDLSFAAIG